MEIFIDKSDDVDDVADGNKSGVSPLVITTRMWIKKDKKIKMIFEGKRNRYHNEESQY